MLESLTLRNFQAHKKLKLKFGLVSTIIGPSDAGKSAVIRALRLLALNRPGGTAFIHKGTTGAKITLKVDGHTISRARGTGKNNYKVDGKTLKAFGDKVPADVERLLNVGEVNFQRQHDSPFWFAASAGEVSRQLNQIINLGTIDRSLAYLNSKLREANALTAAGGTRLAEAKAECKRYAKVPEMLEKLGELEELDVRAGELAKKALLLRGGLETAREGERTARQAGKAAKRAGNVAQLGTEWGTLAGQVSGLRGLLETARAGAAVKPAPDTKPLENLYRQWTVKNDKCQTIQQLVQEASRSSANIQNYLREVESAEKQFKALAGERCPLCQAEIKS